MFSAPDRSDDAEVQAARGVLLTLKAALPCGDAVDRFLVDPGGEPEPAEEAAVRLAAMPKPLRCGARHVSGRLLEVVCADGSTVERSVWDDAGSGQLAHSLRAGAGGVLLTAGGESLHLSRRAVEVWVRDYLIDVPYGTSGTEPTEEQRKRGVSRVIRIEQAAISTTSVDDLNLPEPLRSIIAGEFERVVREHEAARPDGESPP